MKRIFFLLFLNAICLLGVAQSNIRLNNYWENPYYINPASINRNYRSVYTLAARKQWVRFPGSPSTFFGSATTYLDNSHIQFGIKAYKDKIGYTSTSNVSLSYGYALPLNEEWKLNFGLAGSFQSFSYDLSERVLPNGLEIDDNADRKLIRSNNYNSDLGIELEGKEFRMGASSQNIFSLFTSADKQQVNTNYLYAMYRHKTSSIINFGYGLSAFQYKSVYQLEMQATTYFKTRQQFDLFQVGLIYRPKSEMGTILGVNLSESIHLSYSYDFNVSGISRSSIGSHELMITYRLDRCPTCY